MTAEPDERTATQPDPDAGSGTTGRKTVRRVLLGVVLVALCGTVIWLFTRDDRPRAEPGQRFDPPSGTEIAGRSTSVAIPWGRLSVTVGTPVEELPSSSLVEPAETRSPRGGSFVGVSVDIDLKKLIPMPRLPTADLFVPEIVLLADGRRYPVDGLVQLGKLRGTLAPAERSMFVAVEGEPKDLRLEVGYDGQRRIVDLDGGPGEPGRFAGVDRVRTAYRERNCGRAAWPAAFANARESEEQCWITWAERMPYVAGLGWAPDGKAWLVVTQESRRGPVMVAWQAPSGKSAEYVVDAEDSRTRFALGDTPARAVVDLNSLAEGPLMLHDQDRPQQAIFQVDAEGGPLTVTVIRDLHTGEPDERVAGAPDSPVVPISWQVAVP